MLRDIVEKKVEMHEKFSPETKLLLSGLLERDPNKRLGASSTDAQDIIEHPFFKNINWVDLRQLKTKPPYVP